MTRYLVPLSVLVALLLPAGVLAAPSNAPTSMAIPVICTDGNAYTLIVNAGKAPENPNTGAPWEAAHVGGGGVMTVYSLTMGSQTYTKNGPDNPNATPVTCSGTVDLGAGPEPVISIGYIR